MTVVRGTQPAPPVATHTVATGGGQAALCVEQVWNSVPHLPRTQTSEGGAGVIKMRTVETIRKATGDPASRWAVRRSERWSDGEGVEAAAGGRWP